ncbi:hypothetical protein K490DRAFT_57138 [Saccharata proteae CBS 121410]|uniref:Uncharacterized protein n=1 Tax=Saccharata proteae CBS 121410 TaxID=1314787 RepID=A0A9P4HXJ0_9PEZI|nr:hypothetical protein K490DRAFT_57138 [Saccharata proteae CBS 121410]
MIATAFLAAAILATTATSIPAPVTVTAVPGSTHANVLVCHGKDYHSTCYNVITAYGSCYNFDPLNNKIDSAKTDPNSVCMLWDSADCVGDIYSSLSINNEGRKDLSLRHFKNKASSMSCVDVTKLNTV